MDFIALTGWLATFLLNGMKENIELKELENT